MASWEMEQIGDCTLYRGDAQDVLPTLMGFDAVITDPPYGIGLTGKRALVHGTKETFRPGSYDHPDTLEYLVTVVVPLITACRTRATAMAVTPGIRHMWCYPEPDDVGCFYMGAGTGIGRWGFTCMQPILYYGKDPYLASGLGSRPNSCGQRYPNDANAQAHPCAKPLPLMLWLVQRASLEGMTILDPFAGLFTTGVAALQLRRAFVGIEMTRRYFDAGCHRIEEAYRQLQLFPAPCPPPRPTQEALFAGDSV